MVKAARPIGARPFNRELGLGLPVQLAGRPLSRHTDTMDQPVKPEPADEILTELAKLGSTRTWEPGSTVVTEGEVADSLYIIHSGELFGELMLSGGRRAATVQVTTRAQLTCVTRAEVERALVQRPELALELIDRLVQRVRTLTKTVRRLASVDVYGRLVGLFDSLAVTQGGLLVVPGPLSQARIAERLGASKAMVNRLLQDLAHGGYIEIAREHIVLLKKLPPRW